MVNRIVTKYATKKGITHTHSFKITRAVVDYLRAHGHGSRLLTHSAEIQGSRDKAVRDHSASPEPTFLVSPSMTEGLDLKEDLGRWQIICKVPWPSMDPYIKARMQRDPDWYTWLTCLTSRSGTFLDMTYSMR